MSEYNSYEELFKPSNSALIVWDVQNMLVQGIFNKEQFMNSLNNLINSARSLNIPIFYTKITPLPERFESPVRKFLLSRWGRKASWGNDPNLYELAIKPEKNEIVINKNTASIFVGTNFELMIRNAGITTLVFTGIATEIGVESSARHAFNLGFLPVIAEDAVSSSDKESHERSLANMKKMLIVMKSEEIISYWEKTKGL
ncbi:isochorismatase family cysteine hydrolase [Caldisphaera sp.]|uniref:isochorismatase family cysteine hydrolase n=1 Tax=Caldisphaera sp. TaxID=2060322 RepID=UPI003D145AD3